MATSYTLATLQAAVIDRLVDSGTDFAATLPLLIKKAEDRLLVDLNLEIFDSWVTLTFSNGSRTATMAADAIKARQVYFTSSGSVVWMEERTQSYILDYSPTTTAGTPKFWAPYGESTLMVGPVPGATPTTGSCLAIKRPNSLNTDTTGTWLSKYCGSLLEHALLVESARHLKKWESAKEFDAAYIQEYLPGARAEFRHLIRVDYSPIAGTPSPKGTR